jgi:hypothetical protein
LRKRPSTIAPNRTSSHSLRPLTCLTRSGQIFVDLLCAIPKEYLMISTDSVVTARWAPLPDEVPMIFQ